MGKVSEYLTKEDTEKITMQMKICSTMRTINGFPDGSVGKESACEARDSGNTGLISALGRSSGGENGNPLQYSCLKKTHGQTSLGGYSPEGCK